MTVETAKENICVNQIVGQKNDNMTVEGDMIVPDIKPDVMNIIYVSGEAYIYKKDIIDDKIRLDGNINVYIMYLADGSDSPVRGVNTILNFMQLIDMPGAKPGMNLDEDLSIKSIDCKILNGRKLSLTANLNCNTKLYSNENMGIVNQINNVEDIQMLNKELEIASLVAIENTKVYAKENVSIDNTDNLAEILCVNMKIINKDMKVSYNKILGKADLDVKIIYLTEDNRINTVSSKIPVMGFIDITNTNDNHKCNVKYKIKNILIKPNTIEEHSIYVEAEVELLCQVFENKHVNIIQDVYSPKMNIEYQYKNIDTMSQKNNKKEICNIREKIIMPEIGDNKIYHVSTMPVVTNQKVMDNKIIYEGEVKLIFLFESDNIAGIDSKTMRNTIYAYNGCKWY